MDKILNSSVFGNSVGIISLIIGIISLVITFRTFLKTSLVESQIREIKSKAVTKIQLSEYAPFAIKELSDKFSAISETCSVTQPMILGLSCITRRVLDLSECMKTPDADRIKTAHEFILHYKNYESDDDLRKLVDYINMVINILKKGDYLL